MQIFSSIFLTNVSETSVNMTLIYFTSNEIFFYLFQQKDRHYVSVYTHFFFIVFHFIYTRVQTITMSVYKIYILIKIILILIKIIGINILYFHILINYANLSMVPTI